LYYVFNGIRIASNANWTKEAGESIQKETKERKIEQEVVGR